MEKDWYIPSLIFSHFIPWVELDVMFSSLDPEGFENFFMHVENKVPKNPIDYFYIIFIY